MKSLFSYVNMLHCRIWQWPLSYSFMRVNVDIRKLVNKTCSDSMAFTYLLFAYSMISRSTCLSLAIHAELPAGSTFAMPAGQLLSFVPTCCMAFWLCLASCGVKQLPVYILLRYCCYCIFCWIILKDAIISCHGLPGCLVRRIKTLDSVPKPCCWATQKILQLALSQGEESLCLFPATGLGWY